MIAARAGRDRDERGAVAVMTALAVVVVLAATAFAVDLGMSRASARDMQAVADSVALDTARALPNCSTGALEAAANQSLARQGTTIGQDAPLVVTPGHINPTTRKFVAGSNGSGVCDAVRITSAATVDYAFAPVIGTSSGTTSRSAVGTTSPPTMCFSAGTKALVLNTSESALGPVLDHILGVNLGVGSYSGLVDLKDLNVPLADLQAALPVGTGSALVDGGTVNLMTLLVAQADVLKQQGNAAQAVILESVAGQLSSLTVDIADFLKVDSTGNAGLTAGVNALDLAGTAILSAAIDVANGKNAVKVNDLGINLSGLASANVTATITEPPVIACGTIGVTAKTAQVEVHVDAGLLKDGLLGSLISVASVDLKLTVAQGTAALNAISCVNSAPSATINGMTSLATVNGNVRLVELLGLGIPIPLSIDVNTQRPAGHTFTFPPGSGLPSPPTYTYGGTALDLKIKLAGLDLGGIGTLLGNVLSPILNGTGSTPGVLGLLGIKLGTMDVTVLGRPSCSGVRLVG